MRQKDKIFYAGDRVLNPRFGAGTVVDRWGALLITDCDGNPIKSAGRKGVMDASNIYEVQFAQHIGRRSVNVCRLIAL